MLYELILLEEDDDSRIHEKILYSPAIPRAGETIYLVEDGLRYQIAVSSVNYEFVKTANTFAEKLTCSSIELEVKLEIEPWEYK